MDLVNRDSSLDLLKLVDSTDHVFFLEALAFIAIFMGIIVFNFESLFNFACLLNEKPGKVCTLKWGDPCPLGNLERDLERVSGGSFTGSFSGCVPKVGQLKSQGGSSFGHVSNPVPQSFSPEHEQEIPCHFGVPENGISTTTIPQANSTLFEANKLFVGGIRNLTYWDLKEYFSGYGIVLRVRIIMNHTTGRSRGFGFVTFSETYCVNGILQSPVHVIRGVSVGVRPARVKNDDRKIFVGGILPFLPERNIWRHFDSFGKVEAVEVPRNRINGQRRGFCFVVFEQRTSAEKACCVPRQWLAGSPCGVRPFVNTFFRRRVHVASSRSQLSDIPPDLAQTLPKSLLAPVTLHSEKVPAVVPGTTSCGLVVLEKGQSTSVSKTVSGVQQDNKTESSFSWNDLNEMLDHHRILYDGYESELSEVSDDPDEDDYELDNLFETRSENSDSYTGSPFVGSGYYGTLSKVLAGGYTSEVV